MTCFVPTTVQWWQVPAISAPEILLRVKSKPAKEGPGS